MKWDGCGALLCVCFESTLPAGLEAHSSIEGLLLRVTRLCACIAGVHNLLHSATVKPQVTSEDIILARVRSLSARPSVNIQVYWCENGYYWQL